MAEDNGNGGNGFARRWQLAISTIGVMVAVIGGAFVFFSRLTALELKLEEVETQFCESDVVRNLMHANDLRIQSILWKKTFGDEYPTSNAYYPSVCRHAKG